MSTYYATDKDGNKLAIQQAMDALQAGPCYVCYQNEDAVEEVYHMDIYCLIDEYKVYVNDTINEVWFIRGTTEQGEIVIAYDDSKKTR